MPANTSSDSSATSIQLKKKKKKKKKKKEIIPEEKSEEREGNLSFRYEETWKYIEPGDAAVDGATLLRRVPGDALAGALGLRLGGRALAAAAVLLGVRSCFLARPGQ